MSGYYVNFKPKVLYVYAKRVWQNSKSINKLAKGILEILTCPNKISGYYWNSVKQINDFGFFFTTIRLKFL